ncbi:MAG: OmpA family protein [candidate division Zixibacteria bacterium]|nr:OmpA family protein [candidate division Zixibacteria bacterium]
MKKRILKLVIFSVTGILLASCAARKTPPTEPTFKPIDLNSKLRSGEYNQKVETFVVILDASSTMSEGGKFKMAKEVASRMNQTIPDMQLFAALRSLGEGRSNETRLIYGTTSYKREDFESAILGVRGFGATPLGHAIEAASEDLRTTRGKTAVIILSDGKETDRTALQAAKLMKDEFGDRLCIYTVLFGDDPAGRSLMEQIAHVGECGYFVNAEEIYSGAGMATLAENVFLEKAAEPPAVGARLDSDGDGVPDDLDECPDTPKGATVNSVGCWAFEGVVLFDFDRYDIKSEAYPLLNEVVAILRKNAQTEVEIQGHTDHVGSAEYNQSLSEKRAKAVMDYLLERGVEPERLSHKGYGFTRPVASNDTEEGRARNRRVELRRH